jgi:quinol-cytochrome oxidoreductase complex cytochrome b subunit
MVLLSTLATIFPVTMGPRADPLSTPEIIKPEWYFYVAFRWLKLLPLGAAVLSTGFIVFVFFAWPFVDGWIRRRKPESEASVWIGLVGVCVIVALTGWEAVVKH